MRDGKDFGGSINDNSIDTSNSNSLGAKIYYFEKKEIYMLISYLKKW